MTRIQLENYDGKKSDWTKKLAVDKDVNIEWLSNKQKGKIMTAFFYLTPNDILNYDLSDRIFIIDSWWSINRIIDYNANGDQLTKVELISVDYTIKNPHFTKNDIFN